MATQATDTRVKWTRQALSDMEGLLDYWEATAPATREKKLNTLLAKTDRLESSPALGLVEPRLAVSRPSAGLRYVTVGFSKVIYQLDNEVIWIKQVIDSRSDPANMRSS